MRKPIGIAIAFLLVWCTVGRPDDVDVMSRTHDDAQNKDADLSARVKAIENLGRSYPMNCRELMHLKAIFKDILTKPLGDDYKHNLLFFHAAKAIGNYGPLMKELAPDLTARMGRDRILDGTIEEALSKILCSPVTPMCPPCMPMLPPCLPVMPPVAPPADSLSCPTPMPQQKDKDQKDKDQKVKEQKEKEQKKLLAK